MAEPLTHGQQVTLLGTEASTASSARKAGKSSGQGAYRGWVGWSWYVEQEMKGMMTWSKRCFVREGPDLPWLLEQHLNSQV